MGVIIIAEAGVNHNGDIEIAKKLIDSAKDAGVDYVKFQTFKAEKIVNKNAVLAEYQKKSLNKDQSQFEMLKKLELSEYDHEILINYCKEKDIKFLSTGFDIDSINYLSENKVDFIKIPSGEITNYPYLVNCASKGLPVILSTGMSTMQEINQALDVLLKNGLERKDVTVLHCNTEYPTPMHDVNLLAMQTIKQNTKTKVGYSDHTIGIEIPIAAVALGAMVIEKHFTLSRKMEGPDHNASIEPHELKKMVFSIRNIEMALGDGIKKPSKSEMKNISVARKSIHIAKNLSKGTEINELHLTAKRPGDGISPMEYRNILGKKAVKNLAKDHKLAWEDIE